MTRVPAKEVSFSPDDGLYLRGGEPFTGTTFTVFPNGQIESESEYREGLTWGRCRSWYKNGQLYAESEFAQDVVHGTARNWSRDGVLIFESV